MELSSQLPEGVDAITKNGKIYVSSTADDPAKGVFREYLDVYKRQVVNN